MSDTSDLSLPTTPTHPPLPPLSPPSRPRSAPLNHSPKDYYLPPFPIPLLNFLSQTQRYRILANLSQTSRINHVNCTPILYKTIHFHHPFMLETLLHETLPKNKMTGHSISTFDRKRRIHLLSTHVKRLVISSLAPRSIQDIVLACEPDFNFDTNLKIFQGVEYVSIDLNAFAWASTPRTVTQLDMIERNEAVRPFGPWVLPILRKFLTRHANVVHLCVKGHHYRCPGYPHCRVLDWLNDPSVPRLLPSFFVGTSSFTIHNFNPHCPFPGLENVPSRFFFSSPLIKSTPTFPATFNSKSTLNYQVERYRYQVLRAAAPHLEMFFVHKYLLNEDDYVLVRYTSFSSPVSLSSPSSSSSLSSCSESCSSSCSESCSKSSTLIDKFEWELIGVPSLENQFGSFTQWKRQQEQEEAWFRARKLQFPKNQPIDIWVTPRNKAKPCVCCDEI